MTGTLITVAPAGTDSLVATAKESEALGAAAIHVPAGDGDRTRLRETVAALHESTGLIVQLATAEAVHVPERDRWNLVDVGADVISIPMESPGITIALHTRAQERGIVPEYRIFGLDQLALLQRVLRRYDLPFTGRLHLGLRLGIPGEERGAADALVECERVIRDLPAGTTFSAAGLGRSTLPVMLAALAFGGHLRVGTTDTVLYAENRPVDSDMQLVARAVGFAQLAQRPPLTSAQARDLLGVPPR
ncbi:MAG TPA: 3-keto-5-aminohexanoate cleavage protein [Actinoplanes sp.]|nr:3-keto-5-aminohexanoate cleavage protein [Actinoplanes sp.]